ncbi:hypothetical protein M408DRAFT_333779 [Serendipita vermifera MAFF 305830]|uniref:Uncharacterized protein n=1 Tax=Serendipita vermifera MAFF 305830 TaxID=933852 RepID=A0A0C3ANK3_SERVB|nr:hypothetical protein M408DRAFT_333779 [Serendipita vermifera MAFF 305830]
MTLCYRYGVQDGPSGHGWPIPKRIDTLRRYHARWNSLRWLKGYTFRTDPGDLWEMFSSVYAGSAVGSSQISFRKAVSSSAQQREAEWSIDVGNLKTRDFGMDYFQDLVVIVGKDAQRGRTLYLRTMSTGARHPSAKSPDIEIKKQYEQRGSSCLIQVSNDRIGIVFWNETIRPNGNIYPAHELIVWDWKAGTVLLHLVSNEENLVSAFCFLSDTHILVAWGVVLDDEVEEPHKKSTLDVYDVSQQTTSPTKRFHLPPLQPEAVISSFSIYCDPTPTPNHKVPRPFYTSPDRKICVVTANFFFQRSTILVRESINFIFFTSTLLADYPGLPDPSEEDEILIDIESNDGELAETNDAETNKSKAPPITVVPWAQWGEQTRMTIWRMPTSCFLICVSGTRVVRKIPTTVPRRYKIQVCDFNPYAAVDEVQVAMPGKPAVSTQRYVHARQDNVFGNSLLFQAPVYGFLPYLEVTTRNTFEMEEVMIDHDNLYLVHRNNGFEREMEVLSF